MVILPLSAAISGKVMDYEAQVPRQKQEQLEDSEQF